MYFFSLVYIFTETCDGQQTSSDYSNVSPDSGTGTDKLLLLAGNSLDNITEYQTVYSVLLTGSLCILVFIVT